MFDSPLDSPERTTKRRGQRLDTSAELVREVEGIGGSAVVSRQSVGETHTGWIGKMGQSRGKDFPCSRSCQETGGVATRFLRINGLRGSFESYGTTTA